MLFSLLEKNAIGTPAMLVRRQCQEQTGGFDEGLRSLEDWELMAQRNILNDKVAEVLLSAKFIGYYDEAKQMLAAALRL